MYIYMYILYIQRQRGGRERERGVHICCAILAQHTCTAYLHGSLRHAQDPLVCQPEGEDDALQLVGKVRPHSHASYSLHR